MKTGNSMLVRSSILVPAIVALALASVAVLLAPGAAEAQDAGAKRRVHTNLDRPAVRTLRDWLKNRDAPKSTPPQIAFKVPAVVKTAPQCRLSPLGMACYSMPIDMECPTNVTVDIQGAVTVAQVDCTGPDSEGNCECDFVDF